MRKKVFPILAFVVMGLTTLTGTSSNARARSPLLQEAQRQLSLMQTSAYQHHTQVDEETGRFNYDCSGFLDYAIKRVLPEAYAELPISKSSAKRPLAQDYYTLFSSPTQSSHWIRIGKVSNLHAGDIVAWLRPPENDSNNTGHVMLVRAEPELNPSQPNEILVPIIDSTTSPHAQDSRRKGQTGLGIGVIGILINSKNEPIGYHWRGALSSRAEKTAIAFGRIRSRYG